ncbi:unnamed protein product [Linum tenue]|uniref:Uncharacterized protein n=1 Tax=Linum tenue TaxID=586396 RepID=A0AAV0QNU5_9ROSI|nr:unnamed protein product [Linum tenue]
MPRSSRHKSSKHSSKDAKEKDYSDSEKETSLKERKSKEESGSARVLKESAGSGEKRKLDLKENKDGVGTGNGEYAEEYSSSSKRRKDRVEDGGSDRWNGGEDGKGEVSKKLKEKLSSKRREESSRRDENVGNGAGESEEVVGRRSSGKSEGKHKESSSRKDGADRDKDDVTKDGRCRDKNHEGETRHRDDKQRDDRASRDHINSKHSRDEQEGTGSRHKKSKPQDIECDRDRDSDYDRDCDHDIGRDRGYERGRDSDRHRERVRDRENDRDHDWEWDRDRERDKDRDRDRDRDYDSLYVDDRRDRNRESRSRKRSPDDLDDDAKLRSSKGSYADADNKFSIGSRIEGDADRGRSQSRQSHHENFSGSRRRASPVISSQGAADEYRYAKAEDVRYRDDGPEQRLRTNNSRDASLFSGGSDRSSKLRSSEKPVKMDDGHSTEPLERTTSSKASPMGLVERSPSSTSLERRYMGRNNVRRSLEIDESGRRNSGSMGARDVPSIEDRSVRDLPMDKEDSSLNGSSFYNRSSQPNSHLNPPPPSIRGGVSSPSFLGSFDDDGRLNTNSGRYKRTGDLNMGRGQVNAWRGAPNWPSPLPNGFIPFQHGPHHGGFPPMLSPFPNPSLFVRPSMELSHSGIPYHITDADRFSGHLRPLGWQNIMDGSGSSHLHGWDGGSNGIFRDDGHMFGGPEWNQNRHAMNGHGWDSSTDIWKGQNGDITTDLTSKSLKEDNKVQASVDDSSGVLGAGQKLQNETCNKDGSKGKAVESKPSVVLAVKESSRSHPKTTSQQRIAADPPKTSSEDRFSNFINAYLPKVDISSELASSDLYSKCMGLLKVEVNASVDEDADVLINLKDGARAVPKNSSVFFSNALFPASSDSIFKRAMDIYKKQRASGMPCIQGGIIDAIQASSESKEEEQQSITLKDGEKVEEPLTSNLGIEVADAPPVFNVEQKVPGGDVSMVSTEEVKMDEIVATTPTEEVVPVCVDDIPAHNLESVGEEAPPPSSDAQGNNPSECMVGGELKVDEEEERLSDTPMSEGSLPDNPPRGGSALPTGGQVESDEGNSGSTDKNVEEEKMEVRVGECSAVEDDDGCSSRATEGLMPGGTNESDESVLLSRIHHSPESTH